MKKKTWIFITLTTLAAIITISLLLTGRTAGDGTKHPDAISLHTFHPSGGDKWLLALAPDKTPLKLPDTANFHDFGLTHDRTMAYLVDKNNCLYIIGKNGCEGIADSVNFADLSLYGNVLVYVSDALYRYDMEEKSTTKIAACTPSYENCVISPDGTAIAYYGDGCRRYVDGVEIGEPIRGIDLIAISDHGEYFYYSDHVTADLYVIKGGGSPQRLGLTISGSTYYFNKDCSQMLYSSEGRSWLYDKGETILLSEQSYVRPIPPESTTQKEWYIHAPDINYDTSACVLGLADFLPVVCRVGGSLCYLTKGMELKTIATGYDHATLSEDGNSLLYSCDGELYRVPDLSTPTKSIPLGKNLNARYFKTNADLSEIYYDNEYGDIYYLAENGAKCVCESEVIFRGFQFTVSGDYLYWVGESLTQNNYLYCSKYGETPQGISSLAGPCRLYREDGILYYKYESDGVFKIFVVEDGKLVPYYQAVRTNSPGK